MALIKYRRTFRPYFGFHQYNVNKLWLYDGILYGSFFMTQLAAGFAAKGLLILMTRSSCGNRFGPFNPHHLI